MEVTGKQMAVLKRDLVKYVRRDGSRAFWRRFHPLLLILICLWVVSHLLPWFPSLPGWICILALPLALVRRSEPLVTRVRRSDQRGGFNDLLCAAVEVPDRHPFAAALGRQATTMVAEKRSSRRWWQGAFMQQQRPLGLLYAFLAFLLFLFFHGFMPLPGPDRGTVKIPGDARAGLSQPPANRGGAKGGKSAAKEKAKKPQKPRPRSPGPPRQTIPRTVEKVVFTVPPAGTGPEHKKKVFEVKGHEGPGSTIPAKPKTAKGKGPKPPSPPPPAPEMFKRSTEKALGDGVITPGEAWLARRLAEALGK